MSDTESNIMAAQSYKQIFATWLGKQSATTVILVVVVVGLGYLNYRFIPLLFSEQQQTRTDFRAELKQQRDDFLEEIRQLRIGK